MGLLLVEQQASAGTDLPTLITASAAALTAIVAAIAVRVEGKRIRRQMGIENMWRLIDTWDSHEFRAHRTEAASFLLETFPQRPARTHDVPYAVLDLLNMFELLGYLVVRSKTLPLEDAWINFSAPAVQWWHVCRPIVELFQAEDVTVYEDYTKLADRFMEEDARRLKVNREDRVPSNDDLRDFLGSEKALVEALPPWKSWLVRIVRKRAT
ncbi:MAG: hypothetical protein ACRDK3_01280 [Actinomycetota bacterium]